MYSFDQDWLYLFQEQGFSFYMKKWEGFPESYDRSGRENYLNSISV